MFTSRSPRDKQDIFDCVSFFQNSSHGSPTRLSREDIISALETLLRSGHGIIEVIENRSLEKYLKIPNKAAEHRHFQLGFVSVTFAIYVKFDVLQEILAREDDSCDPLLYFLEIYDAFLKGKSPRNPITEVDRTGRILDPSPSMLCCTIYHKDVSENLSLNTVRYLLHSEAYATRVYASCAQDCVGFRFEAVLHSTLGKHFVPLLEQAGMRLAREFSGNHFLRNPQKKYLFSLTLNEATARRLGKGCRHAEPAPGGFSRYTYMFPQLPLVRQAGLTKRQQNVAYLLMVGYSYLQIARVLDPDLSEGPDPCIERLKEKKGTVGLTSSEQAELVQLTKFLKSAPSKIQAVKNEIANKLHKVGLFEPPFTEDRLVQVLMQNSIVAAEVREYFFPIYPWPEDLISRRG